MIKTNKYQDKLTQLELTLQNSLSPVTPNPKFVDELNHKLHSKQVITETEKPLATAYLIISFGLFFGVFCFWLIRKIVRDNRSSHASQA